MSKRLRCALMLPVLVLVAGCRHVSSVPPDVPASLVFEPPELNGATETEITVGTRNDEAAFAQGGPSALDLPPSAAFPHRGENGSGWGVVGVRQSYELRGSERAPIEEELALLGHVLGSLRAAHGAFSEQAALPRPGIEAWERILDELDALLYEPAQGVPQLELVRAKVMLEREIELDREVWRVPGHLLSRLRSRLALLDHQIQRGESGLLPIPEGEHKTLLAWPVDPVVITSQFGWRRDPFHGRAAFHHGIDLRANLGQLVSSAGAGVVRWADWNGAHGKHVEVRHAGGWVTRYSHLAEILVRAGDEVEAGDPLGLVGQTGRATGPHLHFEIWDIGEVRDPVEVLGEPPLYIGSRAVSRSGPLRASID